MIGKCLLCKLYDQHNKCPDPPALSAISVNQEKEGIATNDTSQTNLSKQQPKVGREGEKISMKKLEKDDDFQVN